MRSLKFDNKITVLLLFSEFDQATKGTWWMPWRLKAMKDAFSCDKLRGAAKKALIRRCPNGATHPAAMWDIAY